MIAALSKSRRMGNSGSQSRHGWIQSDEVPWRDETTGRTGNARGAVDSPGFGQALARATPGVASQQPVGRLWGFCVTVGALTETASAGHSARSDGSRSVQLAIAWTTSRSDEHLSVPWTVRRIGHGTARSIGNGTALLAIVPSMGAIVTPISPHCGNASDLASENPPRIPGRET